MKIKLDKETITLAEAQQAKEFAAENDWIDKNIIESVVCGNLGVHAMFEGLIGTPELTVTKNNFRLTVWVRCWALFYRDGKRRIAKVSADVLKWVQDAEKEAFIVEFEETRDYITSGKPED